MNPAETYILDQHEPFRSILLHIKAVVEVVVPEAELKYKWKIPCFYTGKTPLCYLNVPPKKDYVDVGFWNSAQLTKHLDKMVSEKRKVVKSLRYTTLEAIDDNVLTEVLQEACALEAKGFYKKRDLD
ncbi:DUF1801 domain-containing protein [uncultured Croceitalea sp.]|uniref:DUF1801 domain-containing protein n=1 Tax=uncultured Croceitalea sp. TaxID=1798908 RepID=UPI0033062BE6